MRRGQRPKPFVSPQTDLAEKKNIIPGKKPFYFEKPNRIVTRGYIHCSASDNPKHDNTQTIDAWHRERGFDGIGYHAYINKEGHWFWARDLEKIPAAQRGYNTGSIAICVGGLQEFTEEQMETLIRGCKAITKAYDGKITWHGHCEVSNKSCPVFDYRSVLKLDYKGNLFGASKEESWDD